MLHLQARLHIYVGWFESIPDTHEISTLYAHSKCSCQIAHIRRLVESIPDTHEISTLCASSKRLHIYVGWFESIPDTHEISTLYAHSKCSCKIAHIRRLV